MAEAREFVCNHCGHSEGAWSDGHPFYIDETGNKKYAYHPHHDELAKCIANDEPHLCLQCGVESTIDSRLASKVCPECGSEKVVDTFCLDGVKCPKCKVGHFVRDENVRCIS